MELGVNKFRFDVWWEGGWGVGGHTASGTRLFKWFSDRRPPPRLLVLRHISASTFRLPFRERNETQKKKEEKKRGRYCVV